MIFKTKWRHKFNGVDPKVQTQVNEWFDLSTFYGLNFNHEVTIGFDSINRENVVAQCENGVGFREITIDSTYWENMDSVERAAVLWHEMSHCYCNEKHQFGKDHKEYDEDGVNPPEGFFIDSCPKSLMYPYSIYEGCIYSHFPEYIDDMFQNCTPY